MDGPPGEEDSSEDPSKKGIKPTSTDDDYNQTQQSAQVTNQKAKPPASEIVTPTSSTIADLPSTEVQSLYLEKSKLQPAENSEVFRWRDDVKPVTGLPPENNKGQGQGTLTPSVINDLPSTSSIVSLHLEQKELKPIENSEAFMYVRNKPEVLATPTPILQPPTNKPPSKPPSTPPLSQKPLPRNTPISPPSTPPMPRISKPTSTGLVPNPTRCTPPNQTQTKLMSPKQNVHNAQGNSPKISSPANSFVQIMPTPISISPMQAPKIGQKPKTPKTQVQNQMTQENVQRQAGMSLYQNRMNTDENSQLNKNSYPSEDLARGANQLTLGNAQQITSKKLTTEIVTDPTPVRTTKKAKSVPMPPPFESPATKTTNNSTGTNQYSKPLGPNSKGAKPTQVTKNKKSAPPTAIGKPKAANEKPQQANNISKGTSANAARKTTTATTNTNNTSTGKTGTSISPKTANTSGNSMPATNKTTKTSTISGGKETGTPKQSPKTSQAKKSTGKGSSASATPTAKTGVPPNTVAQTGKTTNAKQQPRTQQNKQRGNDKISPYTSKMFPPPPKE